MAGLGGRANFTHDVLSWFCKTAALAQSQRELPVMGSGSVRLKTRRCDHSLPEQQAKSRRCLSNIAKRRLCRRHIGDVGITSPKQSRLNIAWRCHHNIAVACLFGFYVHVFCILQCCWAVLPYDAPGDKVSPIFKLNN